MPRTRVIFAVLALALSSIAFAQTTPQSFDGCTKNCISCERAAVPAPAPGINLKTCNVCYKSSPKVSPNVPQNYDCSGPAIANCENHSVEKATGVVTCASCLEGFQRKVSGTVATCEALSNDFQNCRRGTSESCTVCIKDHTLTRPNITSNF